MKVKKFCLLFILFICCFLISSCSKESYISIAAGNYHACAITTEGKVACWGDNQKGQLGNGNYETISRLPVEVKGLADVKAISAAGDHTCALSKIDKVYCWGSNNNGELGNGTKKNSNIPVVVATKNLEMATITTGNTFSCITYKDQSEQCWGQIRKMDGTVLLDSVSPSDITLNIESGSDIKTDRDHFCSIDPSRKLSCWGNNADGELGNGSTNSTASPTPVTSLKQPIKQVIIGDKFTCALTEVGSVYCWGNNYFNELGDGTTDDHWVPNPVPALTADVAELVGGANFGCVLMNNGQIKCWGTIDLWTTSQPRDL